MARPTTLLPRTMPHILLVTAWSRAPSTNRPSAIRIILLRPRRSARMPVAGETNKANSEVQHVMSDLSRVVSGRWERSLPMETRVADMTPVSSSLCCQLLEKVAHGMDGGLQFIT